ERREFPWQVTPFISWDMQPIIPAKVPTFPHRRQAFGGFMRNLPTDETKHKEALRYLDRVGKIEHPDAAPVAFKWIRDMENEGLTEHALNTLLAEPPALPPAANLYTLLQNGAYPSITYPPVYWATLPRSERQTIADEVRSFAATLPKDPTARKYV